MSFDIDLSELGLDVDAEKAQAVKDALASKYQELLDTEFAGLKGKNGQLIEAEKKLKQQLAAFEGIDPERARKLEEQIAQSEEARLIADGKLDEVINQRTERMRTEYERKLQEASQIAERSKAFADRFRGRVLSDEIRAATAKVGMVDSAAADAALRANALFEVNDEGDIVAKEEAGLDANGKLLTIQTWLESMKESAPHWFLQPKGSGAPGNSGGSASPRAWKDAKTTAEKVELLKRKNAR